MWQTSNITKLSRPRVVVALLLFVAIIAYSLIQLPERPSHAVFGSATDTDESVTLPNPPKLHILLPASNSDVNLCKTLLSLKALDYPQPTIIGWNEQHDTDYLLGGGSHVAKISKVLQYLQEMPAEADNDLVLMMDAFDIWLQLRPETLIERYHSINQEANTAIKDRMGRAADIEKIEQKIIFGAGKRCAPNQLHTISCFPVPPSPLPADIYDSNTDTIIGRNKYTSLRQRFLNSGYVLGPAKDMRVLFARAEEKVQHWPNPDPEDNGSHGSDFMYHGSDQSVFNVIFGEQEFQREVMHRRHLSWFDKLWKKQPTKNIIEGTVVDDVLNPDFIHQNMEHLPGRPCEFGIGLDYWSQLGHQTANADFDGKWLKYGVPLDQLQEATRRDRNAFDCEYRGQGTLPSDVRSSRPPLPVSEHWDQVNLYTNLCLDTIPVMVHHNGDKSARERQWPDFWLQSKAKQVLESALEEGKTDRERGPGAKVHEGDFMTWEDLCPAEYQRELYRE